MENMLLMLRCKGIGCDSELTTYWSKDKLNNESSKNPMRLLQVRPQVSS